MKYKKCNFINKKIVKFDQPINYYQDYEDKKAANTFGVILSAMLKEMIILFFNKIHFAIHPRNRRSIITHA